MKLVSEQFMERAAKGPRGFVLAGALALSATGAEVFTVDTAQSRVTISGNVTGAPLQEQGPGSLMTRFRGILAVELTPNSIQFAQGSRLVAQDSGAWSPLADGSAGIAPANYGGTASDTFSTGWAAVRHAELDVSSGVLAVANGGFDARTMVFTFPSNASSSAAYRVEGFINGSGASPLAGHGASGAATTGTLATTANRQILTIPISYTTNFSLASQNDSQLTLTGQLVAVRNLAIAMPVTPSSNTEVRAIAPSPGRREPAASWYQANSRAP